MSPTERRATGAFALLLLAWEASGADLALSRVFGSAHGFAARDSVWASTLMHDGGRTAAWLLMAALVVAAMRAPVVGLNEPSRRERTLWLGVTLLALLLVPALKRASATSCPWDLAEFGGGAAWVSHFHWGVADGGPGHCFPSGHATAAFAFLSQYFLWRPHNPQRARRWLWAVAGVGTLFGVAQLARGAHFASHTLWTAALCWALGLCASAAFRAMGLHRTMQRQASPGAPHDRSRRRPRNAMET